MNTPFTCMTWKRILLQVIQGMHGYSMSLFTTNTVGGYGQCTVTLSCHQKQVMTFGIAGDTKLRLISVELSNQVEESLTRISTLSLTINVLQFHLTMVCFTQLVTLHIFQIKSVRGWYRRSKWIYFFDIMSYILDMICAIDKLPFCCAHGSNLYEHL